MPPFCNRDLAKTACTRQTGNILLRLETVALGTPPYIGSMSNLASRIIGTANERSTEWDSGRQNSTWKDSVCRGGNRDLGVRFKPAKPGADSVSAVSPHVTKLALMQYRAKLITDDPKGIITCTLRVARGNTARLQQVLLRWRSLIRNDRGGERENNTARMWQIVISVRIPLHHRASILAQFENQNAARARRIC